MSPTPKLVYHISTQQAWAEALACGQYTAPSLQNEGFIHFSFAHQVAPTAQVHYAGQSGLIVLTIDRSKTKGPWKDEASRGDALFPHLYGPLETSAVLETQSLESAIENLEKAPSTTE